MAIDGLEWATRPDENFGDQWNGWGDFLGNGKTRPKTPTEYIRIAEALAAEHGGVLPCPSWLMQNGFRAMEAVIRRNPNVFEHIPKESMRKRIEEHVKNAELLAESNGGTLPGTWWLRKNGHKDLDAQIRIHPDLFSHIPRARCFRTPEEWAVAAYKLAKAHDGILPCVSWLRKNGYNAMSQSMRIRPDLFSHIPQSVIDNKTKKSMIRFNGQIQSNKVLVT